MLYPCNDEKCLFILTSVEIAILGGISNWLVSENHSVFKLIANIFVAGFVGLLVGQLSLHYGFAESWSYFLAGASGVAAEAVLHLFRRIVVMRLELLLSEKDDHHLRNEIIETQLGELLKERFGVSEEDIEFALRKQHIGKMKIGEILVAQGVITQETLDEALKEQLERVKNNKKKKKKKEE